MAVAKPLPSHGRKILCQVCGALSSGLHFGVFTCEGCKCFYRRSIREGANYACAKDRGCDITMETRNSCRYCRFQKCLTLGMSKEGIKLGRRPKVECDPLHQVYFRHNDPSIPTMAPTSTPSQQWPHMSSIPTSTVIQIKTELSEECTAFSSKPLPYRQYIKQEPEEAPYLSAYSCHFNGQTPGHHLRARPETSKVMDQWHSQAGITAVWKSETGQAIQINPYFENTNCHQSGAHSQPPMAWTPMQASPDDSGRGSVDPIHWEEPGGTPAPLNIPDVQTGAIAAMAFANLYRDTTERSRPAESVKRLSDSNNNGDKDATEDEDEKSYIELMPRNKQEGSIRATEGNPCQNPFRVASPGINCAAQSMAENFQQVREMLSSDSQDTEPTSDKTKLENERHHSHNFSTKQDLRRKRAHSFHDGMETKKTKLLPDDCWRATSSPTISQVLWELTSSYVQMESEILQLYNEHKHSFEPEPHENVKSNTSQVNRNELEVSENFCRQKRDHLKKLIQNFIKLLKDKNANWISTGINEQIPVTFITRICLLRKVLYPFSSTGQHPTAAEISAEEAACLATLSLIYEKNSHTDDEKVNHEKQRLTKDIRDVLKERGFRSQKLQLLLEQQHHTNPLS